jgi:hypothetical protein
MGWLMVTGLAMVAACMLCWWIEVKPFLDALALLNPPTKTHMSLWNAIVYLKEAIMWGGGILFILPLLWPLIADLLITAALTGGFFAFGGSMYGGIFGLFGSNLLSLLILGYASKTRAVHALS